VAGSVWTVLVRLRLGTNGWKCVDCISEAKVRDEWLGVCGLH